LSALQRAGRDNDPPDVDDPVFHVQPVPMALAGLAAERKRQHRSLIGALIVSSCRGRAVPLAIEEMAPHAAAVVNSARMRTLKKVPTPRWAIRDAANPGAHELLMRVHGAQRRWAQIHHTRKGRWIAQVQHWRLRKGMFSLSPR
jgi:hypothetical protein